MTDSVRTIVTSDGARLSHWLWRAGGQPGWPLVLIHGAASNHTRWSEFLERTSLRGVHDLLRPDMRGNGRSQYRGRLDLDVWSSDLEEILDAEGYRRALLVGHSLGAQIALRFAHRFPERTGGLALIDPVVRGALRGHRRRLSRIEPLFRAAVWLIQFGNRLGLRRRRFPHQDLKRLDEETRRAIRGDGARQELGRRYSSLGPILRHMPTANYLQQLIAMVAPLPPLTPLEAPVLVLLSAGIEFADPRITRAELDRLPAMELEAIDATHWPLTERPDEVRRAIERWVEKLEASGVLEPE